MFETLQIERSDAVATVWLNRPDRHNAFNATLIAELDAALAQLADDAAVRVVVLGGRGKSFSAGADLSWMKAQGEAAEADNLADAWRLAAMFARLAALPKPTIARVHGAALGGGMGLASACDLCIAADVAVFATSEVRLGLIPSAISPYVIRAIGTRQAQRYFLTGEGIVATRAAELGLAHAVVSLEALDDAVKALTATLLRGSPQAQGEAKALIDAVAGQPLTEALREDVARRIARLRATDEAREGLNAFLEKRPAAWVPGEE